MVRSISAAGAADNALLALNSARERVYSADGGVLDQPAVALVEALPNALVDTKRYASAGLVEPGIVISSR